MQPRKKRRLSNVLATCLLSIACLVGGIACTERDSIEKPEVIASKAATMSLDESLTKEALSDNEETAQLAEIVEESEASEATIEKKGISDQQAAVGGIACTERDSIEKPEVIASKAATMSLDESLTKEALSGNEETAQLAEVEESEAPEATIEKKGISDQQAAIEEKMIEEIVNRIIAKQKANKNHIVEVRGATFTSIFENAYIKRYFSFSDVPKIRTYPRADLMLNFAILGTNNPTKTKGWTIVVDISYQQRPFRSISQKIGLGRWFMRRSKSKQLRAVKKLKDLKLVKNTQKLVEVPIRMPLNGARSFKWDVREGFIVRWGLLSPGKKWNELTPVQKKNFFTGKKKYMFKRFPKRKKHSKSA